MTRKRTALDNLSSLDAELIVVLLFVLAMGLSVLQYVEGVRHRVRRVEGKLRRRASRRVAA